MLKFDRILHIFSFLHQLFVFSDVYHVYLIYLTKEKSNQTQIIIHNFSEIFGIFMVKATFLVLIIMDGLFLYNDIKVRITVHSAHT